jgi:hypothetical protein
MTKKILATSSIPHSGAHIKDLRFNENTGELIKVTIEG